MDKLVRNTRVSHAGKSPMECHVSGDMDAIYTSSSGGAHVTKKRKSGVSSSSTMCGNSSIKQYVGPSEGDVVLVNQSDHGAMVSLVHSLAAITTPIICMPATPIRPIFMDMHVCYTDNMARLYPSSGASTRELQLIHTLHQRVSIRTLPIDVAMEQQRVLDASYLSDIVMSNATRSMYICTSCALAGRPTPLRHPMRYSMLNQRFTCMSCHRQQRAKGQQQQRRDKGAKLMSSDTSIICVDMIGKVVYTGMDLAPSLWRCVYVVVLSKWAKK